MDLTTDYRTLWATFNAPVQLHKPSLDNSRFHKVYFEVGPFKYVLVIKRSHTGSLDFRVEFFLLDIEIPPDKTVQEVYSEFAGEEMSEMDANELYEKMLDSRYGVYNLKNLSFRVLSAVIQSVKAYFSREDYQCVLFSSDKESRTDLYRRMINTIFPGHKVTEGDNDFGGSLSVLFKVCKPEVDS